jgi:hypothetical protein
MPVSCSAIVPQFGRFDKRSRLRIRLGPKSNGLC